MYSYEDRIKAVKRYIQYGFCVLVTTQELGCASPITILKYS